MTVEKHWTDLKYTKDAYNRQDERELFEALEIGLQTAAAACRAIAHLRQQSMWPAVALGIESMREQCQALAKVRQLSGNIILAPGAIDPRVN